MSYSRSHNRLRNKKRPRNKAKINWLAILNTLWVSGLLALFFTYVLQAPELQIETVNIEGAQLSDSLQLDDIRDCATEKNIILLPKKRMFQKLMSLPQVEEATIIRRFPNTVVVNLEEKTAVASLQTGDTFVYLTGDGVAFHESPSPAPDVPILYAAGCEDIELGKSSESANLEYAIDVLKSVYGERLKCRKILVDRNANMCLNMSSGLLVKLGQPDDIPEKISQLRLTLEYKPSLEREALYVDVSCPAEKVYMPKSRANMVL